jgi:hypothetical protein
LELRHLLAVPHHDGVLADEVHTTDMTIEIDADTWPVETRCDLLHMARLTGAMPALYHDAAVVHEAGEQGQGGVAIEHVVRIERRYVLLRRRERRHLEVRVDLE